MTLTIILLAFSLVCLVIAAFWQPPNPPPPWRPHLGWLGLAFLVLADLLGRTSLGH